MADACLETGTHYLDVTGEIDVFEALARRGEEAMRAGVTLLPGVGFDVVPSDCLAVHVAKRIDEPKRLRIGLAEPGIGGDRLGEIGPVGVADRAVDGALCEHPAGFGANRRRIGGGRWNARVPRAHFHQVVLEL